MGQYVGDAEVGLLESNRRNCFILLFNPFLNNLKRKRILYIIYGLCLIYLIFLYSSSSWFKESYPMYTMTQMTRIDLLYLHNLNYSNENIACNYPKLKPFDQSILKFVEDPGPLNCSTNSKYNLLFESDYNSNLVMREDITSYGFQSCCYKSFARKNEDEIEYSESCEPITSNITQIPSQHEFVVVYCISATDAQAKSSIFNIFSNIFSKNDEHVVRNNGTSEPVNKPTSTEPNHLTSVIANNVNQKLLKPVDLFNFVRLKPEVEDRIKRINSTTEKLNIIVLGLDSMSHMNLIRTMPKTYEYLTQELGAIGMNGYTKVGDNTFPNMLAALMGKSEHELDPICWNRTRSEYFDECPFIWKNFTQEGYRTSYAEDATQIGIFNYLKKGFKNQPTDYYLRPLTSNMNELVGHTGGYSLCYGPRLGFSILLENIRKLVHVMGKERRYFQFTWATALSHENLNFPTRGDAVLQETFQWLHQEGHLENTVLIFMSDHGMRYGALRETFQGRVEESMPFLYYRFPQWFMEKYGSAVHNMKLNSNRLTTPFDFHETLKDLLHLKNIENRMVKERHDTVGLITNPELHPRCISLFLPVPTTRTCDSARIPGQFCFCHQMEPVSVEDDVVQEAASFVVDTLNQILEKYPQCSDLSLKEVSSSQVMLMSATDIRDISDGSPTTYSVTIVTAPGDAKFEATVSVTPGKKRKWSTDGSISRINEYGTQSHCVPEYSLKMYCYCQ